MFTTTHKLEFEVAPWELGDQLKSGFKRFRVGSCEGLWECLDGVYEILAIKNTKKGNGHLDDVFEWFEMSAKRDGMKLRVLQINNINFMYHLIEKRGFVKIDGNNVEKSFDA